MKFLISILLFLMLVSGASAQLAMVIDEYPPLISSKLDNGGFASNLASQILKDEGYQVTLVYDSFENGISGLKSGKYQIMPALHLTQRRREFIYFSIPFIESKLVLVTHQDNLPFSIEKLKNKSTAYYGQHINYPKIKSTNFLKTNNALESLNLLEARKVDYAVVDIIDLRIKLKTMNEKEANLLTVVDQLSTENYHIGVSQSHPKAKQIIQVINDGLRKMKRSGELEILIFEYFKNLDKVQSE